MWLASQINSTEWRGNRFILSTITGSVDLKWFQDNVKRLYIQPLDQSSHRDLVKKWQIHLKSESNASSFFTKPIEEEANQAADHFFSTVWQDVNLDQLNCTPHQLMQACILHANLPTGRCIDLRFYQSIYRTAHTRWKMKKEPERRIDDLWNTLEVSNRRRIIGSAAHYLLSHSNALSATLPTDHFLELASPWLDQLQIDSANRQSYLLDLAWQTSLLKFSDDTNSWHLPSGSFQEFICADHWCHTPDSLPDDWMPLIAETKWQGTLRRFLEIAPPPLKKDLEAIMSRSSVIHAPPP